MEDAMTDKGPDQTSWKTITLHATAHVVGAIAFACLALGFGLMLGGFVTTPQDKCIWLPTELTASLFT
jgi:hypothetical protein